MAIRADLDADKEIFVGEKRTFRFTVLDSDNTTVDGGIGDWTLLWTVKMEERDTAPVFTKTNGQGLTITDPVAGYVDVTIDRDDTVDQPSGVFKHTLWRTDGVNDTVLSYGDFVLLQPVVQ